MSHPLCPRQMAFTLDGNPGVQVTATESGGSIQFSVDVVDSELSTGDLRALFFHIAESELSGLTISSASPLLTEWRAAGIIKPLCSRMAAVKVRNRNESPGIYS